MTWNETWNDTSLKKIGWLLHYLSGWLLHVSKVRLFTKRKLSAVDSIKDSIKDWRQIDCIINCMKRDKMIPFLARFVSLCPALQNLLKFSFFIILEAFFFEEILENWKFACIITFYLSMNNGVFVVIHLLKLVCGHE